MSMEYNEILAKRIQQLLNIRHQPNQFTVLVREIPFCSQHKSRYELLLIMRSHAAFLLTCTSVVPNLTTLMRSVMGFYLKRPWCNEISHFIFSMLDNYLYDIGELSLVPNS
ncbi:DNA-binding protein [Prunus dulcis]|uniref:DNA-binding protein n=1 Tax=Prunus dulcis TaxID=3755 RepID=A0A4Y1R9J1_PRUDU|nr:DNA-binding protein [Prunus dulcis]